MCTVGRAPKVLDGHELKNVNEVAPNKVELQCRIDLGRPPASVRWYRNRICCKIFSEISKDHKCQITSDGDIMSLIIAKSETSDSATYRCEAANKFGITSTVCRVSVRRTSRILPALYTAFQKKPSP